MGPLYTAVPAILRGSAEDGKVEPSLGIVVLRMKMKRR
jgi:hypothetical protein